jgi:hypothetical protein
MPKPIEVPQLRRRLEPLIVDKKMKRFWVLVDPKDGTMNASCVSADYSVNREGDYEVTIFPNYETAKRAAAHELLHYGAELVAVEVVVLRREIQ